MRIKDIEVFLLSCPVPEEKSWRLGGSLSPDGRTYLPGQKGIKADTLILRIITEDGLEGIGEGNPRLGASGKNEVERLKPQLLGQDPFDVIHWPCMRLGSITGGVNMACWDIVGKATGKPVCHLLGSEPADRVRAYASGGVNWNFVRNPEVIAREARSYLEAGWTAFKFRIPPDDRCIDIIKAAKEAVGDEMDLIIEGNMRFRTAKQAIRIAKKFEKYDPLWFEEPLRATTPADMRGYLEIRAAVPSIPISGGEGKMDPLEFKTWIDSHAYDIVQPDCLRPGITGAKKIAYMAELEGILCCPHDWFAAPSNAANLHLVASIPNRFVLEIQTTWWGSCPAFRAIEGTEILKEPLKMKNGYIEVPTKPGLGIEFDEKAVEKFPYIERPWTEPWEFFDKPIPSLSE